MYNIWILYPTVLYKKVLSLYQYYFTFIYTKYICVIYEYDILQYYRKNTVIISVLFHFLPSEIFVIWIFLFKIVTWGKQDGLTRTGCKRISWLSTKNFPFIPFTSVIPSFSPPMIGILNLRYPYLLHLPRLQYC